MSNNPFAKHGIQHLSPSSLNCWRESPGVWALRYLANIRDDGEAAMWRGSAVENGWAALLHGKSLEEATDMAHQAFDQNAAGEIADEISAERDMIAPMLEQCIKWKAPSDLLASQIKIEHWLDDVPVPVIGYVDFAFDGIDVDLKTTKACPSSPRPNHARQVALYRAARKRGGGLLYVTPKRREFYPVDDDMAERALNDLRCDALSLMAFLARMDSARDAIHCLPMDTDNFRFKSKTKVALEELLLAG